MALVGRKRTTRSGGISKLILIWLLGKLRIFKLTIKLPTSPKLKLRYYVESRVMVVDGGLT